MKYLFPINNQSTKDLLTVEKQNSFAEIEIEDTLEVIRQIDLQIERLQRSKDPLMEKISLLRPMTIRIEQ